MLNKSSSNTFINTCLDVYESNDFSGLFKSVWLTFFKFCLLEIDRSEYIHKGVSFAHKRKKTRKLNSTVLIGANNLTQNMSLTIGIFFYGIIYNNKCNTWNFNKKSSYITHNIMLVSNQTLRSNKYELYTSYHRRTCLYKQI